ncbi:hypothetical protein SAMN05518865_11854 [Duganella sp. CF458]|uniref:hypothetical protein n=1 Tax=Duganella sp. CF458 TaxID=1884368 RepID=UPI0008E2FE4A|nr:hypothetical protein [Duganella sp. CF458]SFG77650.1 hypothetical protein SAMN05518865_11854 [Duganella sp. CF458]
MSRVLVIVGGLLAAVALLFAAYVWLALSYSYSEGERAGYLQKFSKRGWICKTWEGEILLTSMPGAIPEKFEFTVQDDVIASQIAAAAGKRVVLHYAQHKGIPTSCFGDTQYFVESVSVQP